MALKRPTLPTTAPTPRFCTKRSTTHFQGQGVDFPSGRHRATYEGCACCSARPRQVVPTRRRSAMRSRNRRCHRGGDPDEAASFSHAHPIARSRQLFLAVVARRQGLSAPPNNRAQGLPPRTRGGRTRIFRSGEPVPPLSLRFRPSVPADGGQTTRSVVPEVCRNDLFFAKLWQRWSAACDCSIYALIAEAIQNHLRQRRRAHFGQGEFLMMGRGSG